MRFANRVVVVTGGANGIGYAAAQRFAAEKASVVINDLNAGAVEKAVEAIRAAGGEAMGVAGDVSSPDDVERNVDIILEKYGRIDVLMANAGLARHDLAQDLSYEDWRRMIAVNLDGVFLWCQRVGVKAMLPTQRGSIVAVASMAGLAGIPNDIAYVAAKHGVVGIVKALAVEWGQHGIRVNCLCPGITETEMVADVARQNPQLFEDRKLRVPLGRPATPDEQAAAAVFMASDDASYLSGHIMNNDGGQLALFSGYSIQRN